MTFQQDEHITPVLFRVHRSPKKYGAEVTAVFPCEPHDINGRSISCYAHVGQHGACDYGWYLKTRPATPEEYASLRRELEGAPFGYRLKPYQRMHRMFRDVFNAEVRRLLSLR